MAFRKDRLVATARETRYPEVLMTSHRPIGDQWEKAYLFLRKEVPYSLTVEVDEVAERANGTLYVQARILTSDDRYKKMIIGNNGYMIKEIGMATRKELETATRKKVFMELRVAVTGKTVGPPLLESFEILGKEETLARLSTNYE